MSSTSPPTDSSNSAAAPEPTLATGSNSHWAKDGVEEDRVEALIRRSGCWDQHLEVVDCMGEKRDWRACQQQLNVFRECMVRARGADAGGKVDKKAEETKK